MLGQWRQDLLAVCGGVLLMVAMVYSVALTIEHIMPPDDEDEMMKMHDIDIAKHGGPIPPRLLSIEPRRDGMPTAHL